MYSKLKLIILLLYFNFSFSQNCVPLDEDTFEFIEDVNYHLFLNKKIVFSSICNNDKETSLPINIQFDSITFSKINYKTLGIKKDNISNTILLSKNTFSLDEIVVISPQNQEIILGEKNRFVKRKSNSISKEILYGISFKNKSSKDLEINKILFYIDKIKYKTAYKINLFEFNQNPISIGHQYAEIGKLFFSTDTLYLQPKEKGAIEVKLKNKNTILNGKSIFLTFELIANYDENNKEIQPNFEDSSKIKFQLSDEANYFAKMVDATNGILTPNLININAMINYDFAYSFFKKPHKSSLVAPAILLYTKKVE